MGFWLPSYHFSAQIIGRSAGRSSVAAAAYRAGQRLTDERQGRVFDFANRRGIHDREILLPDGVASWLADRNRLWNHVEAMERRKDAQLAREINMALPHELSHEQRRILVREYVLEQFVSRGMVADVAWHDPVLEKGDDPRNFHAHILLTLRQAGPDGLRPVKTREWNSDRLMEEWRGAWAQHQNRALGRAGIARTVDHRTLEAQRQDALSKGDRTTAAALERKPELHVGPRARASERSNRVSHSKAYRRPTARSQNGNWHSSRTPEKRSRIVEYQRIDRGSRAYWNSAIVDENIRRMFARSDRLERHAARLRQVETRAMRVLTLATMPSQGRRPGGPEVSPLRVLLARRHQAMSRSLLKEVERLLSELLHVRNLLSRRRRELSYERVWGRDDGRRRT